MNNLFSKTVSAGGISFKHAKGVSDRSDKEFHLYHEIILFLGGKAELITERVKASLTPNTLIIIPKETYHQLVIEGEQNDYYRCVFQFTQEEVSEELIKDAMGEVVLADIDKSISGLFHRATELTDRPEAPFLKEMLCATLVLILCEIRAKKGANIAVERLDDNIRRAIEYISDHLTENITLKDVSKALNISLSSLMHTFKKNMKISPHQYILKKRLILAHMKIASGEPATSVALDCGFGDYSGFYRQYKKMFDSSPTAKK